MSISVHPAGQPAERTAATRFECHLQIDATLTGQSATDLFAAHTALSRTAIKQAMRKGAVWLTRQGTRRLRRADKTLRPNDEIHLYHDPAVLGAEPPPARLIADEQAFSVWFKPGGMLSQGSKWGDHCTLARWVEAHLEPERPAIVVHRLDRAASGLMLIAHRKRTAVALAELFRSRQLQKTYTAVVHGHVSDTLRLTNAIDRKNANSVVTPSAYDPYRDRSLVQVQIQTGRKHQIRLHLAGAGHPILGDRLYGRPDDHEDLCLTASELAFVSPLDGRRTQYALPADLLPRLQ